MMLQRGILFPMHWASTCCPGVAVGFVLAPVGRAFLSCSTFPLLLAPKLRPSHSFPQFSSLRPHFVNPFHLAPRHSPLSYSVPTTVVTG